MQPKRSTLYFLIALFIAVLAFTLAMARPFLGPVITAAVLAIALLPVHVRIERLVRRPGRAALLSTLLALVLVLLAVVEVGLAVSKELTGAYHWLSERSLAGGGWGTYLSSLLDGPPAWLSDQVGVSEANLRQELTSRLQQISGSILHALGAFVGGVTSSLASGLLSFLFLFVFLRYGREWSQQASAWLPLTEAHWQRLSAIVFDTITANVHGIVAVGAGQGLLVGLAFWFLGVPSPVLWGLIAAFASLVPVVGAGLVWIPAAVILGFQGNYWKAAILVAWGILLVGMWDNVVRPWVVSGRVKQHPLLIALSMLGGAQAFGILGLLFGPVAVSLLLALATAIREEFQSPAQPAAVIASQSEATPPA